jgi:superoxide reductase
MVEKNEIYKCSVCGNVVEVVHVGGGQLVCCGKGMELMQEKTEEEGLTEKHKPVIEKTEEGTTIKVASIEHPMEEKHYIEWIEAMVDGKTIKKYLSPGEKPEMSLCDVEVSGARAYCNIHGLWKSQ